MESDRTEDCKRIVQSAISEANDKFQFESVFHITEAGIVLLGQLQTLDLSHSDDDDRECCEAGGMGFNTVT